MGFPSKRRFLNLNSQFSALWLAIAALPATTSAQSNPNGQFDLTKFPEPYFLLVRDPYVHQELKLSSEQRQKMLQVCHALDSTFWKLRGGTREQALTGLRAMVEPLQQKISSLLTTSQRQRLAQIQLQLAGFQAFLRPEVVKTLLLSTDQQADIQGGVDAFQKGGQSLQKRFDNGDSKEVLDAEAYQLRSRLRETIVETLSNEQKAKWQTLVGNAIDGTKLGKVKFKAPPVDANSPWLNTATAKVADEQLRGRVVALHFYAFQCINCKRNQPWYKDWHAELKNKGLIVLGIHTPEVSSEFDVEQVKANAKQTGLTFPIVIDNEKQNWKAWGNTMWPTTYLIDKQGFVRYWWMGELNWKDAGMQEVFKKHIEELLAE